MALVTDYNTLKTAVTELIDNDAPEVTGNIDYFIQAVEARIDADLRVRQMAERWEATTEDPYLSLPPDFLEMRRIAVKVNGCWEDLNYLTPEQINRIAVDATGSPRYYTITGNAIQLMPAPAAPTGIEIAFYQRITPLSDTNTTNWLMDNYPHIYMDGALMEAHLYLFDEARAQVYAQRFDASVARLQQKDKRTRYSGGSLQMRLL